MKKTSANAIQTRHCCDRPACRHHPTGAVASEHQALNRLLAATDERSRRLILGMLAQKEGRGGIARLARITGLHRNTITRGRRELLRGELIPAGRVRRPGGGRKRVEANAPGY